MKEWFWYHMNNIYTILVAVPSYIMLKITGHLNDLDEWVDKKRKK